MNKKLTTLITAASVVLMTTGFAVAENAITGTNNFPYFHLGSLIVVGLIITSLHSKYKEMRLIESIGSFALYVLMIALFTDPVVDAIKAFLT
jgi:hypothetical protein